MTGGSVQIPLWAMVTKAAEAGVSVVYGSDSSMGDGN